MNCPFLIAPPLSPSQPLSVLLAVVPLHIVIISLGTLAGWLAVVTISVFLSLVSPSIYVHARTDHQPVVLNAQSGEELSGNDVEGVLAFKRPWPSLTRTVYGDHQRYLDVYLRPYKVRHRRYCR